MGSEMLDTWGPERTQQVNPLDEWLALGADLAAGTDIVRPFNPMTNVWGMATRGTKTAGIVGPEHAIDVAAALRLYTMGTAALDHEQDRPDPVQGLDPAIRAGSHPWEGGGGPVPVAPVRGTAERSLADTVLASGDYRQHDLPEGALLGEQPIAATEVHLLLDGLLIIEADHQPVLEAGPGAVFDPSARTSYSKQHVTVRATTACRLAVLPRAQLDSQALLGIAAEQRSRLDSVRNGHEPPQGRS